MGSDDVFGWKPNITAVEHNREQLRRMEAHHVVVALAELGRQLTIAAALTRAWQLGWASNADARFVGDYWEPGRRRPAP